MTYEKIRAMKGRGTKVAPADVTQGDVIRVDAVKYLVLDQYVNEPTGSLRFNVYSEDNQMDTLFLGSTARIALLGHLEEGNR